MSSVSFLVVQVDLRADGNSDRLLDLESKPFFAKYIDGNEKKVAYMMWSAQLVLYNGPVACVPVCFVVKTW